MSVDVTTLLFTPSTVGSALAFLGATASVALGASALVPAMSRRILPLPTETRLVDFMPFTRVQHDGMTIETKRGDLVRVIECAGAELYVTNQQEHEALGLSRRTWLSQIAEKGAIARIFTIRSTIPPGECLPHPNPVLQKMSEVWEASFIGSSFHSSHYVVLSVDKDAGIGALEEACQLTIAALDPFGPKVLSSETPTNPLAVLARLASPISKPRPKIQAGARVADQIVADTVAFANDASGLINFTSGTAKKHVAVLGLKTWGDYTEEKMLAQLASLPFEYVLYHYVEPLSRLKALQHLDGKRRLAKTNVVRFEMLQQFDDAQQLVEGGGQESQVLCRYSLSILVEADTIEELNARIAQISTIAAQYEVTLVREGQIAQAVWWSMFPTYDTLPRPWSLLAVNIANLLALQRNIKGYDRCPWGEGPVTIMRNSLGNPYKFVFHDMSDPSNREPLGHMLMVGPAGQGKTTIATFLATSAMRYPDLRVFLFDRFSGTEVITNVAGGQYINFNGAGSAAMNPLQMDMTPENRDFLSNWLKLITDLSDERSSEEIGRAIEIISGMPLEQRNLKNVIKTAFEPAGNVRSKLMPWVSEAQHGSVFCAERDTLDLDERLVGFDFTSALDPERRDNLGPALVSYIMHRTMDVTVKRGYPSLYFIDETQPLLKNEFFRNKFARGLQEGRKLGQVYICAFQRPDGINEGGIGQAILGQCTTQIFFRNTKQSEEDYAAFDMTPRELDFVLGRSHRTLKRAFLLRRLGEDRESIIIDSDLSSLGPWLRAFASGNASVRLMRQLKEADPQSWLSKYMEV